ncbi:MAG: two component transcriptional regulator, LuxR family [Modestobacter sp.]|jgi:DNA-binding NarL/FixJ family response regulator|nr:two component transcriptional regulator, LuxR family [Modestobacter sp.]HEV7726765.1 response regulator transcription factor [Modestobacter sp.]
MRVVLCDDHRLFVEPLAAALTVRGHEVAVVHRPADVVGAAEQHQPDVCVLDLRFPEGDGLDAVAALRSWRPECPVLVLSGSVDVRDLSAAAAAGAAGFLRKDQPITAIFDALDRIAAGREVALPPLPRPAARSDEQVEVRRLVGHLTARERDVLRRLVEAEDTVVIARALGVAPSTARTHLQNVLQKLGVHTRLQAVALVVSAGLDVEL